MLHCDITLLTLFQIDSKHGQLLTSFIKLSAFKILKQPVYKSELTSDSQ